MQHRPLFFSFRDAFRGMGYVLRTQRNAKIQCGIGTVTLIAAAFFRLPPRDWALLALTITAVLAAEAGNTVVETMIDEISPSPSEMARIAKDASAGAVLLVAIGAIVVGLFILGPPLWKLVT
jgi:undecaprenol kinase